MIDLHTHILPSADDGASTLEEAESMLRQASRDGISRIALTPHVNSRLSRIRTLDELRLLIEDFRIRSATWDIPVDVVFGAEIHLTEDIIPLLRDHRPILTLNGSSYVLVEFPEEFVFPHSRELLYSLMQEGYIPILAHPERNSMIQGNIRVLQKFIEVGALCQMDAGSLTGFFGQKSRETAHRIVEANLVHTVASDAHNSGQRPPILSQAYRLLAELKNEKEVLYLESIPNAILADEAIPDIGPVRIPDSPRSFWKRKKG